MKLYLVDIANEEDRQKALAVLTALAPVLRANEAPVDPPVVAFADAPAKKPRRTQKANGAAEPTEPAAEPTDPAIARMAERLTEFATAPVVELAAALSTTEPVPEVDEEAVRESLRQVAHAKGVVWLRKVLASYQATRLGDLTPVQAAAVLQAAESERE
jgi:hypothetical protein